MAFSAALDEARDHLRVIRQTMERSTQYSTLSGWSGVLIGCVALAGCALTAAHQGVTDLRVLGVWSAALVLAVGIEFACNKRRARGVGKHVISRLGAHILIAAAPGFFAAAILSFFFIEHNIGLYLYGIWMLCYGAAICAVGLFSQRPVSMLGVAFVVAGGLALVLPVSLHLAIMAASFGGFHITYGIAMARKYGW
jgi:hypothetical protein